MKVVSERFYMCGYFECGKWFLAFSNGNLVLPELYCAEVQRLDKTDRMFIRHLYYCCKKCYIKSMTLRELPTKITTQEN